MRMITSRKFERVLFVKLKDEETTTATTPRVNGRVRQQHVGFSVLCRTLLCGITIWQILRKWLPPHNSHDFILVKREFDHFKILLK